jgi:hypothetical protein
MERSRSASLARRRPARSGGYCRVQDVDGVLAVLATG